MKSFLKMSVFSAAVFMVLAFFTDAFCAGKSAEQAVFFVKEKVANVGEVYGEGEITYDFIVENHGNGELYINRVKAG
ncbi:hypothetical protein J7M07_05800 [bacterium]|nr:hypothetical protein [bacterium]